VTAPEKVLGGPHERSEDPRVILGTQAAEMTDALSGRPLGQRIDLRADSSDIAPIAPGDPESHLCPPEKLIVLR
jgi:hypothetical protein